MSRYNTPLRYPGGKQRLTRFVEEVLETNQLLGGNYVEPYAGGAGVAIELLLANRVQIVHLNDSSRCIYAFWTAVTSEPEEFCRRILSASLDIKTWKRHREVVRHPGEHALFELGFSTFYLNRCNRSGVLTAGVIGGLRQSGRWKMDARFPRNELIRRVEAIASRADRIRLSNRDAEDFMTIVDDLPAHTLVYCDPPYYDRAARLYLDWYQAADHERLAKMIQQGLSRPWIVSYDGHSTIERFYRERKQFRYSLRYSAIKYYEGTEIFIFSDDLDIPATSACAPIARALETYGNGRGLR